MKKINFNIQSLIEKELDIYFKGHNALDVDHFIDLIIEDYQTYQKIISDLNHKNTELEHDNTSLRAKMIEMEGKLHSKEVTNDAIFGTTNPDLDKRVSRLEKEILKLKKG